MRLAGAAGLGHLTYCTNIHAGETWPEVRDGLREHLPTIKAAISPDAPFGVGLRLSAAAAAALQDASALDELRALLAEGPYYVFTINGFPYGAFHGQSVKEGAYRPDWSEADRLDYSNRLADILAAILPAGMEGSISTVPGTFKPWLAEGGEGRIEAIVDNLIRHAAHLCRIAERDGREIVLALEPEPACLLETIEETIAFFETRLYSDAAVGRLSGLTGLGAAAAAEALRRHLGVCYDVCHAAVEFEDPHDSIMLLRGAGIPIAKAQLSAALRIAPVEPGSADQLRPFDEPVYLHQTVERAGGEFVRYLDLPEALARVGEAEGREWRIHFHVPIFLDRLKHFDTTQGFLREILELQRAHPFTEQLEVETYTWDVLPEPYRNVEVSAAIARELAWVKEQLEP